VTFAGADSKIEKRQCRRIDDPAAWAELWIEHRDGEQPDGHYHWYFNAADVPIVDFGQCLVVAVFGKSSNTAGFAVESVTEAADHVLVRFDDKAYQTSGAGGPLPVPPYGMFVLPRTQKEDPAGGERAEPDRQAAGVEGTRADLIDDSDGHPSESAAASAGQSRLA
jgi:hypothetical protein